MISGRWLTHNQKRGLRFAPYTLGKGDIARLHGSNERIAIADYMRAIASYERQITG
jgi:acetylornithine deacetylase/succinyl-diaminopimelate desuccinylase-like protein